MKIVWGLIAIFLVSIGSGMETHGGSAKRVAFRSLSEPELWAIGEKPLYLIVTEKNWSTHYANRPGGDFAKNIYIVASLGMKPNPGHRIKILQIQQEKEKITIKTEIREPDPQKAYAQVLVHPIAVAEVPKANLPPYSFLTFVFTDQKGKEIASVKANI